MKRQKIMKRSIQMLMILIMLGLTLGSTLQPAALAKSASAEPAAASEPQDPAPIYLPFVGMAYPWTSPFGLESNSSLAIGSVYLNRATTLNAGWARMGLRIAWREIQPTDGGAYQWDELADFEAELRGMAARGIKPVVIINKSPSWATINGTSCGAIRSDKLDDFAAFARALVNRYKTSEFNVHAWELGNEPDVDPSLVFPDSGFGCWGDISGDNYGGEAYGEMLKAVTPAMRAEDPQVQVWIGGLLLDSPNTTNEDAGKPELFLKGIIEAGAADYFDVVPFHWYPYYYESASKVDYDLNSGKDWDGVGGGTLGKSDHLQAIMDEYLVSKPLALNETSLLCPESVPACVTPGTDFYNAQANFLVRVYTRGLSNNVLYFSWYTLEGPGWRHSGLLDGSTAPKLAYTAYAQLITRLQSTTFSSTVDYGTNVEAYAFKKGGQIVQVIWSNTDTTNSLSFDPAKFVTAYTRDGSALALTDGKIDVGFEPIYVILNP